MAVSLSGLPGLQTFNAVGEPATLAQRWLTWKDEFELYVTASGISDPTQKKALLLHLAGPQVRDVFNNSIPADKRGEAKDYKKAMDSLSEHFKPRKNAPMARQAFLAAQPTAGETINNFITRLQKLAEHCEYEGERDNQVRDRAISFIQDKNLKAKLYREETLTLSKLLEIVSQYHDKEALVLIRDGRVNNISPDAKQGGKCWRCDKAGHFAKECLRSRDHKCGKCGNVGHFEVCCHSKQSKGRDSSRSSSRGRGNEYRGNSGRKQSRGRRGGSSQGQRDVRQVTEDVTTGNSARKDDFYVFYTGETDDGNTLKLEIADKTMNVIIDSGASCNLMSEEVFNLVTGGNVKLLECNKRVFAYASEEPLQIKGKCNLDVRVPQTQKSLNVEFYVMLGKAATLLGRDASELLGVLRVGIPVNSCDVESDGASNNPKQADRKASLRAKFPKVFQGLGKLKGYQLKLHIDEKVQPVAQPPRRIPFSRREKVTEKLEELLKLDVIEKVEGPTSWVNPLVVVEKPNGDIRICLDMRQANQAIVREKHPVPTVEETLQEVSNAKVFSKLDLNMAFHQIELHPDSRDITTFAAPNGLYRYKRLLFGVNMATEKFQQIVWQIIQDCPGAYNLHDDLRVVGTNDEEHDENLERVMRKLEESGLTLNYDKCEIGVGSMIYMGDVLSGEGLKVSSQRVKAIVEAPAPQNPSEVRSFLGSVQFCSKFIPNFASISSPLWDLTAKDIKWKWGVKEAKSFQEIKDRLTRAPVMAYFRQGAETRLTTDASPVGVGAILEQKQKDGSYRPIYYASRKLSKIEMRYSQFEREALAVRWACEKFYLYLYGISFEVCTDHKPLLIVLGAKSKPPSARIERWLLYLQQFQYKLTHIRGKDNAADVLSRLPVGTTHDHETQATEEFAYSVVSEAVPAALVPKEVEIASEKDPTLKMLRQAVMTDDWSQLQGTIYKAVKDELWVIGQVVMRGSRILIPQSLQKRTIMLAHEGHQGMVRTKARLREKVWWPRMDKQVEQAIRTCHPCQLVGPRSKPEPVRSTRLPDSPWQEISVDLLEITSGDHLLVVVDYYSRWIEAVLLKKTDAQNVIKSMEAIFRTHGLPETVRSDNGPPFASKEFEGFLEYLAIEHKKGVPYWPQSNGEVERCNETLLKIVRIARLEGKDWRKALADFLFQYRVTPHTVTGISPAELLMGRKLRDKLPKVQIPKDRATEAQWQLLLKERDAHAKLRQKEYADRTRAAKFSDIEEGDQVLLKQARENKLSPNYEPEPYKVVHKDGNAVILEDTNGNNKMRNIAHMKKFVAPETTEKEDQVQPAQLPQEPDQVEQTHPMTIASQPAEVQETPPNPLPGDSVVLRPARSRQPPAYLKDYVCT